MLATFSTAQVSAATEGTAGVIRDVRQLGQLDLVVLGSGAGGLTAALSASLLGMKVAVLEHMSHIGGTSARSSGTVWVPDNPYMHAAGIDNDRSAADAYIGALAADHADPSVWHAFLDDAPKMVAALSREAGIGFRPYMTAPDYRQDIPGAAKGGRPLEPLPFDGRTLGPDFERLAWPIPELMVFGGMMVTRGEAFELLRADRSAKAFWLGLRMAVRFLADRLRYKRGTRLVLGNALVGRLLKALQERAVPVLTNVPVSRLLSADGRVGGVAVEAGGQVVEVVTNRGVVLAGGGFPASTDWCRRNLPEPVAEYTPAAPGCDGSTLDLALQAGAALGPKGLDNALWFPSSVMTRRDGTTAVYPHIVLDRAKPGLIAVNGQGRRFVNEAVSYHEFVRGMYRANTDGDSVPAWLVCDRRFIRRYGLGLIRPRTPWLGKYVRNGYLTEGASIEGLAEKMGVPAEHLRATVERFNGFARDGVDADFHRGETIYDRSNGDPTVAPNPCLGPIEHGPFYAVRVYPTPLGTSRGLRADADARVCNAAGAPIAGLYVCGNDMQSAFGGEYPGAGAQLGQAMTFGWIAARHAAQYPPTSTSVGGGP